MILVDRIADKIFLRVERGRGTEMQIVLEFVAMRLRRLVFFTVIATALAKQRQIKG